MSRCASFEALRFMKCPTCGKPDEWKDKPDRPFCTDRSQLVEIGKWVEGEYRVHGEAVPQEHNERTTSDDEG